MPIDRKESDARAIAYLAKESAHAGLELEFYQADEINEGVVYYYDSARHLRTGEFADTILGNAPFLVVRETGEIVPFGTARPAEEYLAEYRRGVLAATGFVFRNDAYARSLDAVVTEIASNGGIELDRTIFYAASGGQPNDTGRMLTADGRIVPIVNVVHPDGDKTRIVHVSADGAPALHPGDAVTLEIDWDRRYRLMRMHTALHLLSVVFPFPVTGGSVGEDKGRLDFDMPEVPDNLAELEARLNAMVEAHHPVTQEWITDAEMAANPGLIKTMKVKPPMGQGRVRLIRIGDIDLQPCGGTHVANTSEIGPLKLGKIEKKGAQNRRVALLFA